MNASAPELDDIRSLIKPDENGIVHVAVFDFDGTCIRGNSPVVLVRYLAFRGLIGLRPVLRLINWGFRYKFHFSQEEAFARQQVFTAFRGKPKAEVDAFLRRFCEERILCRMRPDARAAMLAHAEAGHAVLCVSATFEPILARVVESEPIQYFVSTRMHVDEAGNYTNQVEGLPIEGAEKVNALARLADSAFGEGNWILDWAYADHYSDYDLLSQANHPHAVCPKPTLKRIAKKEGWPILNWPEP